MKRFILLLCFSLVFSVCCIPTKRVNAEEYLTLDYFVEKYGWTGVPEDFISGSLAEEYPYFLIYRSYQNNKYRWFIFRYNEKPSTCYRYGSGTYFYLAFMGVKGNAISYKDGFMKSLMGRNFSTDGSIDNVDFYDVVQSNNYITATNWNLEKTVILYQNFSMDYSAFSQFIVYDESFFNDVHEHIWNDNWNYDDVNHWHTCLNEDGNCDITVNSGMDSFGSHVFDNEYDSDCNVCGYIRVVSSPTPIPTFTPTPTPTGTPVPTNTPTPTPTNTPTPRPTATPTPTPPPFLPGGLDEDGNWVGYTEFEANALNFLQDIKGLLIELVWWAKNMVALLFCLLGFECMKIVSAWIKGGTKGARSG